MVSDGSETTDKALVLQKLKLGYRHNRQQSLIQEKPSRFEMVSLVFKQGETVHLFAPTPRIISSASYSKAYTFFLVSS